MRLRGFPGWAGQSLKQGGRVVRDHSEAFVAFDTSKSRNAVAIAEAGRTGGGRFFGEIDNIEAATAKLVRKLADKYGRLTFCYEAGPTGYGLYRVVKGLGHECLVVAPSLVPKRAGDHVKTNRRDALSLVKLLRAGELTAVWVPDPRHEAMRDLTRARGAAVEDLRSKRQQVMSFLLRQGLHYAGKKTWTQAHMNWLVSAKLQHAEAGDRSRFRTPRELMAYLGLIPSEHSTGDTVRRGPITKAGNRRARRILVECSWSYRHLPRVGKKKQAKVAAAPRALG